MSAAIFQMPFENTVSSVKMFEFRLKSMKFVPKDPTDNNAALV